MRRRTFVMTTAVGITAATAGCSSRLPEDPDYQRCTASFVPLHEIPTRGILPSAGKEAEAALEDGEHTGIKLRYPDLISDDTTLWDVNTNRYYTHRIEAGILTETLIFDEITPSREDSGEIKVSNQTAETVEVATTISADGDHLIDTEFSVDPAEDVTEVADISDREYAGEKQAAAALPGVEFPDEFRSYEIEVVIETDEDEHVETAAVDIHPWFEYYWVQISDSGLLTGTLWKSDGLFVEHPTSKVGVHWECTNPPSGWPQERE